MFIVVAVAVVTIIDPVLLPISRFFIMVESIAVATLEVVHEDPFQV